MQKFIVVRPDGLAMMIEGSEIIWIADKKNANTYPSKYAAKKHLRLLDNLPEIINIVELQSV